MKKAIEIENLSKVYNLGLVGTGTLSKDLNRTWAKLLGKPDPYATLVELNDRTKKSSSNMVYALKDINFSVEQGEVLGIIGKNGAGKSTLLKILSQITSPSTGSIKMRGRVASLLEVGTGMHPEMTARQNIYLNGSLMGMRRREITSKLDEIVAFAGIEKYIDTPTKRFSSGMTVRLGFAIAAFLEPEILIVDEVLAVGDLEFQKKAIGKMQDVSQGEGRTVLFVSHNMTSIENLCKRTIIIDKGTIGFDGLTQNAIELYNNQALKFKSTNLIERNDREGTGVVSFAKAKINDDKPYTGKNNTITIELEIQSKEKIDHTQLCVTICNIMGERICVIDSKSQGETIMIKKGLNKATIIVKDLNLLPATYSVILWIGKTTHTLDCVFNAQYFEVKEYDFYKTGIPLQSKKHGIFYTNHASWNVQ